MQPNPRAFGFSPILAGVDRVLRQVRDHLREAHRIAMNQNRLGFRAEYRVGLEHQFDFGL